MSGNVTSRPFELGTGRRVIEYTGKRLSIEQGSILDQTQDRYLVRLNRRWLLDGSVDGSGAGQGSRLVLTAGSGGHFMGTGQINGITVRFMVDTGASLVVLDPAQADKIGINYRNRPRVAVRTANGTALAYNVRLDSVRVGDVEVYNVAANVVPDGTPFVLLGNSFLEHFRMKQENDRLVLEKRY